MSREANQELTSSPVLSLRKLRQGTLGDENVAVKRNSIFIVDRMHQV